MVALAPLDRITPWIGTTLMGTSWGRVDAARADVARPSRTTAGRRRAAVGVRRRRVLQPHRLGQLADLRGAEPAPARPPARRVRRRDLTDQPGGDGRGDHAEQADPRDHQRGRDEATGRRHRVVIAVADGGDRGHRPPQRRPAGLDVGARPAPFSVQDRQRRGVEHEDGGGDQVQLDPAAQGVGGARLRIRSSATRRSSRKGRSTGRTTISRSGSCRRKCRPEKRDNLNRTT